MKINFSLVPISIFGWCLNTDPVFFQKIIRSAAKGNPIVQDSTRKVDEMEEYAYVFYDSLNPLVIAKAFIGKVEYKGMYPNPSAPHGYIFYPNSELYFKGLLIDDTEQGPDQIVRDNKKL
jgi:hypothetical protein